MGPAAQLDIQRIPDDLRDVLKEDHDLQDKLLSKGFTLYDSAGYLIARPSGVVCDLCRQISATGCPRCRLPTEQLSGDERFEMSAGEVQMSVFPINGNGKILGWYAKRTV